MRDGHTLRVAHLLEALAAEWEITLLAPAGEAPGWLASCHPVRLTRPATVPWRYDDAPLRAGLDVLLASCRFRRALVFAGAEAAWFGRREAPPAIVDLIDCNALEFWRAAARARGRLRAYWMKEAAVSAWYSWRCFRAFRATLCVADTDALWLRRMGGGARVHVVPNGVALPLAPPPAVAAPVLCFTGTLDYPPNIDAALFAAREILPLVRRNMPDATLIVAGRNPAPEIRALAGLPGIEIAADVPEIGAVIAAAAVALAPMRLGSGIKNKVLEAWASARPVVMTPIAASGLSVPADQRALIAGDASGLAAACLRLLQDRASADRLGSEARDHVARHFGWPSQAAKVSKLLRDLGQKRR